MVLTMMNSMFKTAGDNILTALSVARDCEMIGSNQRVVLLTVLPPVGNQPAKLEFSFDTRKKSDSVIT